jgi:DNA-binding NarL/FixJ family response regulator
MSPARLYIVDEHESVRRALVERLGHSSEVQVAGHAGDAQTALSELAHADVDVVLVEIKRSDGMGLELVRQLTDRPHPPRLYVLTSYTSEWEEQAARRAGASGYLLKDIASEDLIRRILGDATPAR